MTTVGGFFDASAAGSPAEDRDELLVDDLDDLLAGVERLGRPRRRGALAHGVGERLDDGQRHVGVEQASRMSRTALLTSDSDRRPLPRRFLKVAVRRSDRLVNTRELYLPAGVDDRRDRERAASAGRGPGPVGGEVEGVEGLPGIGGDVRAADVQPDPGEGPGDVMEQPGAVPARTSTTVAVVEASGTTKARVLGGRRSRAGSRPAPRPVGSAEPAERGPRRPAG